MARTKGMLNLSGNLEVNAGAPLDARTVVPTVADLIVASNFQYKYVGMPVVVQATGDMYILTANDVTVAANWKQVGSGGGTGTNDYEELDNRPQFNGTTWSGNKTTQQMIPIGDGLTFGTNGELKLNYQEFQNVYGGKTVIIGGANQNIVGQ